MRVINIASLGREKDARELATIIATRSTFDLGLVCETVWLKDIFEAELADAARMGRVELTKEKFDLWFKAMREIFGATYVRDGLLALLRAKKTQGVQLLIVADADFTTDYADAFKFWPLGKKMHLGVTYTQGDKGLPLSGNCMQDAIQIFEQLGFTRD